MKALTASVLCVLLLSAALASAEASIRKERVQFAKGETGATIKGTIKGDETVDYIPSYIPRSPIPPCTLHLFT